MEEKIKWELLESTGKLSVSCRPGHSVDFIKKGKYKGVEFLFFQTMESYYNPLTSSMEYKTINSSILPITIQNA